MNNFDVGSYFKTIGKTVTILLLVNITFLLAIGGFSIMQKNANSGEKNMLQQKINEKETQELKVLKERKDLELLSMLLAEYTELVGEKDLNAHLLSTLKKVEELSIQYSLKNTKHEVSDATKLKEENTIPFLLTLEGDYTNVLHFLEDLNKAELPITTRDTSLYVLEDEYEKRFKGTENVEMNLLVYVFEDITLVEKTSDDIFTEDTTLTSPFGFFVYKTVEEPTSGIDEYQNFLQQYVEGTTKENVEETSLDDKESESTSSTTGLDNTTTPTESTEKDSDKADKANE